MMMFPASILISIFLGLAIVNSLWPSKGIFWPKELSRSIISMGIGLGVSSSIFFVCLLIFGAPKTDFIFIELIIVFVFAGLLLYRKRSDRYQEPEVYPNPIPASKAFMPVSAVFYVVLILSGIIFITVSLKNPHGNWDAWAIWNMRARFIFRGGEAWRQGFSALISWSHPDYPLLVPCLVARSWTYLGAEKIMAPAIVSALFTFSIVGLVVSTVTFFRGKTQGLLSGVALLSVPLFVMHGASQYADIPLGFFFLATLVLFYFQKEYPKKSFGILSLAGMTAALACWTKNEGILFLGAVITVRFLVSAVTGKAKAYVKDMIPFMLGLAPILAVLIYFKAVIAPSNDIVSQGLSSILAKVTVLPRYLVTGKEFLRQMIFFGNGAMIALVVYAALLGVEAKEKHRSTAIFSAGVLSIMLIGYFFSFITIPYDLKWSLEASLYRLLLQLWPSFVFLYFLTVHFPEKTLP